MTYNLSKEEVTKLNKNHSHYLDTSERREKNTRGIIIYTYLEKVKNSTLFLDIFINDNWEKDNQETAILFINEWLNKYNELNQCLYYKASIYKAKTLDFTVYKKHDFDTAIKQIRAPHKPLKSENMLMGVFSNIGLMGLLYGLKKRFKPYPFETTIYKLLIDLDLQFYYIDLNSFLRLFTYDWEEYYYSKKYAGIPIILKIEQAEPNTFIKFPDLDFSKLPNHTEYAIITYKQTGGSYNTKATLNIKGTKLTSIEIFKFDRLKGVKLIAKQIKK
jgi:hypothetical protein